MSDEIQPFDERLRLVELVDRVLDRGVVLRGDVTLSVAGVDLVYLELNLLLTSVETMARRPGPRAVLRDPETSGSDAVEPGRGDSAAADG